jgi:hypothetical protein
MIAFVIILHSLFRDDLSDRRKQLVDLAFNTLDKKGQGVISADDLLGVFDASKHPDVLAGKKTPSQVLEHFLETFEVGGTMDGHVTQEEFTNYYTNIGASIDDDNYFELMIRNAWHISGGEGSAANSANRRVLVTNSDGSQSVVEIKSDLGLKSDDKQGMIARLRAQGVNAIDISTTDALDATSKAKKAGKYSVYTHVYLYNYYC